MTTGMDMQIDTVRMAEAAMVVDNQLNVVRSCIDSIKRDAMALKGEHWDGASSDVYHESMIKMCDEQLTGPMNAGYIISALQGYVQNLRTTAAEYEVTEKKLVERKEALPTNVFDV